MPLESDTWEPACWYLERACRVERDLFFIRRTAVGRCAGTRVAAGVWRGNTVISCKVSMLCTDTCQYMVLAEPDMFHWAEGAV